MLRVKIAKSCLGISLVLCMLAQVSGTLVPCALRDFGDDHKVCVCNSTYCDTVEQVQKIDEDEFLVFVSSKDGLRFDKTTAKFSQTETKSCDIPIISWFTGNHFVEMIVNTSIKYQKIIGFGGAFTDAVGINVMQLSKATQEHFLRSYFSEDGIEYNIGRVPIGGSDFSTRPYSYDDGDPDPGLNHFSLANEDLQYKHTLADSLYLGCEEKSPSFAFIDMDDEFSRLIRLHNHGDIFIWRIIIPLPTVNLIPLIQQALQMSQKQLYLLCASWSPPLWMKTNGGWSGFSALKPEYYLTYAKYILRFLDEYKKHDIKFWAVSTGNEPLDGIVPIYHFNSLGWTPSKLANWTANYLGPELRNSIHKDTLLLTFEDQRFYLPWWIDWMVDANPEVLKYIDGFAVHWYMDFFTGDGRIKSLHDKYSDKFILYTEACQGARPWQKKVDIGSWDRGESYIEDIIKNINAWVVGWLDWNMALDMKGGPNWSNNFVDSPVIVNASSDEFYKQPMFYAMGHVSKFIQKDATRVEITPNDKSGLVTLAVQNPDGRIVIVMVNKNRKPTAVSIKVDIKGWINFNVPAYSFATIIC